MKKIKASMMISRNSHNKIGITIQDEASRKCLFRSELELADFAEIVTGLHKTVSGETDDDLNVVGKEKVRYARRVLCPFYHQPRDWFEEWLRVNCQEPGMVIDTYLGSQSSIGRCEEGTWLHYGVYEYVEVPK